MVPELLLATVLYFYLAFKEHLSFCSCCVLAFFSSHLLTFVV